MPLDNTENPDRFTALFENATDAIASVRYENDAFIVEEVNTAFEETFGYGASTLVGSDINDFVIPDEEGEGTASVGEQMRAGERIERQVKRRTTSGVRDFLIRTAPFERDGTWSGGYVIYTEITEQKRRERLLERYETIVDVIPDPVFTVDVDGRFTLVNDAFASLLGCDREWLLGTHLTEVFESSIADDYEDHVARLQDSAVGAVERYELSIDDAESHTWIFESHLTLLPSDDQFEGVACVLLDITNRRKQKERLESLAKIVSHDLRNPLQVAHGRVDALRQTDVDDVVGLDDAVVALDQMDSLINEFLAVARENESAFSLAPVDLTAIACEAADGLLRDDIDFEIDELGSTVAERTQLHQLFSNLYNNSSNHGGESVTVRVESLADGFAVVDDGPGFSVEEPQSVFRRGFTTSDTGTGVGLTIVDRVANIHDWTVAATNDAETGGARIEIRGVEWYSEDDAEHPLTAAEDDDTANDPSTPDEG
ncbi:PAS domain S-box protein [Haloarcula marina]|uniref:PAS domain S-box protein n=1 Tax=Haloarcula marina TaxID=2961574 RepID=UPI0020B855EC|nr:PAS domain S-box protein [Halomicroarcula marina]